MGGSGLMKKFLALIAFLIIPAISQAAVSSVMADEATGEIVSHTNLENRLVAVDMGPVQEAITNIEEDLSFAWEAIGDVSNHYSVLTNSFLGLSNSLNTASNYFKSNLTNTVAQIGSLSNAIKSAEMTAERVAIANDSATLPLNTNYYYVYIRSTLTNWIIPQPSGGALIKLDIDYDGIQSFAWGGALIGATNLPVPPPTGKSSYVLEWITDSTNFTAY